MANLYNINNQEPDEISLFLQQILLRSSSNSSSFTRHHSFPAAVSDHPLTENQEPVPGTGQIRLPESGLISSSGCSFTVANVSSSSVGNLDYNEPDDPYEYESEEGVEALVEETMAKQTSSRRSSSKRSRAAEVHNQSEKRRRSRINEKMKALQNLIPNSNKTDKASMLDEAIEYLKQLQLQVQMLTMRNGLSLYPICLPGMPQHNPIFDAGNKISNTNISKCIPMNQNISAPKYEASLADFSPMIGSKSSFKVEYSSQQNHFGPLDLSKEKMPRCHSPNEDYTEMSLIGHKAISSIPFETRKSRSKESTIEACLTGGEHILSNIVNNPMFSSHLNM